MVSTPSGVERRKGGRSLSPALLKDDMTRSPELGSLQPVMPQTNVKQPLSEEERLAKLSDKELLLEVRSRLKKRNVKDLLGTAIDVALILTMFREPISKNDPYCLKRGKNKFFDVHKIKVK